MDNSVIDRERDRVVPKQGSEESEFQWRQQEPKPEKNNKMKFDDFLNPRAMLTPGIAGSMVMLIANTLWVQFTIPQKWSALCLSFLIIIPILIKFSASLFENIIYFVFNGLTVFAMAVNTNFVGAKFESASQSAAPPVVAQQMHTVIIPTLATRTINNDDDDATN